MYFRRSSGCRRIDQGGQPQSRWRWRLALGFAGPDMAWEKNKTQRNDRDLMRSQSDQHDTPLARDDNRLCRFLSGLVGET
jgi:hypothetical protein